MFSVTKYLGCDANPPKGGSPVIGGGIGGTLLRGPKGDTGPQGPPGPPGNGNGGSADFVIGETPTGSVNNSNASFLTAFDFVPESVDLFVNGLKQKKVVNFTTSGTRTILIGDSPRTNDLILVNYQKA